MGQALLVLGLLARTSPAATPSPFTWLRQLPVHSPSARSQVAMAPRPSDGTVVLFGGYLPGVSAPTNETWTWNGVDWTLRSPAHSPPARGLASMALDPATGHVVLFGGGQPPTGIFGTGAYRSDTWIWDGTDWTEVTPAHVPAPRSGAALDYDPHTGSLLLFGGNSCQSVVHGCISQSLDDTWLWNGSDWTQLDPLHVPLSVGSGVDALDGAAQNVTLFGGSHCSVGVCTSLDDLYTWSGTDWVVHVPAHRPSARSEAAAAYDADTGGIVLFGGYDGSMLGDTWIWNGTDWFEQAPIASPPPRLSAGLAPDPSNPGVVLFGGSNDTTAFGETWVGTMASVAGLDPVSAAIRVGHNLTLVGSGISAGTVLKVFLSTATGTVDLIPDGLPPSSTTLDTWTGTLPFGWPVGGPEASSLGNGMVSLQLVRTDQGYDTSETRGALLIGNPSLGVPSITGIGGEPISPTSTQLEIGTANVEAVITPGASLSIAGEGFDQPLVNIFTAQGNVGPLAPTSATGTSLAVDIPADAPIGPGSVQVVNATGSFFTSNAVAMPIGEPISVTGVVVDGSTVTVTGTGFNPLTVVNLFATSGGVLVNAGGLDVVGNPNIPLTIDDPHQLHFTRPGGLEPGPAYVMAVNPPFIPFTSSGDGPGGSFSLP